MRDVWQRVRSGDIGAVFVSGEPGIGKTRLVAEFVSDQCRNAIALGRSGGLHRLCDQVEAAFADV